MLALCTMARFFVTIAKVSSPCVLGLATPIFYNIIWTGLNRTLKAGQSDQFGKKICGRSWKFPWAKKKKNLLTERKTYFNPVQAILSDKLYPIIITIFKKKY